MNFNSSNKTGASIALRWGIPTQPKCQKNITGYNITFGTFGGLLQGRFWENKNETNVSVTLSDLIPGKEYMIVIIVNYNDNGTTIKRPRFIKSGIGM